MVFSHCRSCAIALLLFCMTASSIGGQTGPPAEKKQSPSQAPTKSPAAKQPDSAKQPTPEEELQRAIGSAGNDRATLVRNLEAF
jgi:hypothetical protein